MAEQTSVRKLGVVRLCAVLLVVALVWTPGSAVAADTADDHLPVWTQADKDGFGTAVPAASPVWFTLDDARMTEVYYPRLDTPSIRSTELVITDGATFAERESEATTAVVELADRRALRYRQTSTAASGRYQITKTYVTDPHRPVVIVDIEVTALDGGDYDVYVLHDPQLANTGRDDVGTAHRAALSVTDGAEEMASTLLTRPALTETASGFEDGDRDPWAELSKRFALRHRDAPDGQGDVLQAGRVDLTGSTSEGPQRFELAIGFGSAVEEAWTAARATLRAGFDATAAGYSAGWEEWLGHMGPRPASTAHWPTTYDVSLMVLKASEDKMFPGASIASPSMPWQWNDLSLHDPSGPYHLVWSRDLYGVATAMLAAGDREGAERALDFLFERQQYDNGSFPQNSEVDGTPFWTSLQLDEVAFPLVLAWQLDRDDPRTVRRHVEPAADFIVEHGPLTEQERWEEEAGLSPSTVAAQIAGLVCAADLARRVGDVEKAQRYEAVADEWQANIEEWAFTTTGPLGDGEYYLRINDDLDPDDGADRELGNGAGTFDERAIVDAGFLELVRLGVKAPDDPFITASLPEIDEQLRVVTPNGPVWYRYSHDGYGETNDGEPWNLETEGTIGRLWPILTGERGEYELAAGNDAQLHLDTIARTANRGYLMPEQVWDRAEPTPHDFAFGEGTWSATPLGWTHAQFVRLAWSIDAGSPVETPEVVACRYARDCSG